MGYLHGGGLRGATNEFWRTLATRDWSNFITNMEEAIKVGREYERLMDSLQAKNRALSLAEADYRMEILETEDIVHMDLELEKAGENEEKKKEIRK